MEQLGRVDTGAGTFTIRRATRDDVGPIIELLAADQLGRERDGGDLTPYAAAFEHIDSDPAQLLVVLADAHDHPVGTLQITIIPGMARRGALRAQIEAVRVAEPLRGQGVGAQMLGWAIEEAERRGCALVQLTSDKRRPDAHRLYGRLGFEPTHEGFKLQLR